MTHKTKLMQQVETNHQRPLEILLRDKANNRGMSAAAKAIATLYKGF